MNKLAIIVFVVLAALILCGCSGDKATPTVDIPEPPLAVPGDFFSANVKTYFKIYLSLPDSYDPDDTTRYPVIYLLDGDWYFDGSHWRIGYGGVAGICDRLADAGDMPEAILVGIGYPGENARTRDFLYPADALAEKSGGGERFYAFLKDELLPYVDRHYRTDLSYGRTLIGHSYGGYFTMFSFCKYRPYNTTFTNFIAVSPSIYWHDYWLMYREEAMHAEVNGALPLKLYMTIGSLEWEHGLDRMAARLFSRNYSGLELVNRSYLDLDHGTVVRPSITDGLKWVFE